MYKGYFRTESCQKKASSQARSPPNNHNIHISVKSSIAGRTGSDPFPPYISFSPGMLRSRGSGTCGDYDCSSFKFFLSGNQCLYFSCVQIYFFNEEFSIFAPKRVACLRSWSIRVYPSTPSGNPGKIFYIRCCC